MPLPSKPTVTFAQLKHAYAALGLSVQETPVMFRDAYSSPVRVLHDGVPYTIDCRHNLARVSTCASKLYILIERHHADIKRLYEAWKPLCDKDMHVMSGGGLQLQAFFSTPGRYEGILYLSHIDDGRFQELEKILGEHGVPFTPYKPDPDLIKGPHTLMLENPDWARKLPLVENINVRCWNNAIEHTPPAPAAALPRPSNPYGDPLP